MNRKIFLYGTASDTKFFLKLFPQADFINAAAYGYKAFYFKNSQMVGLTYSTVNNLEPEEGVLLSNITNHDINTLDTIYGQEFNRRIIAVICEDDIEHFVETFIPLQEKHLDKFRPW